MLLTDICRFVQLILLLSHFQFVPRAGIEPARLLRTLDFESSASTNSATWAKNSGAKVDIFGLPPKK